MRLPNLFVLLLSLIFCVACTEPISKDFVQQVNATLVQERTDPTAAKSASGLAAIKGENPKEEGVLKVIQMIRQAQQEAANQTQTEQETEWLLKRADSLSMQVGYPSLSMWVKSQIGFYYYRLTHLEQALPYFVEASKYLTIPDFEAEIDPVDCLIKQAYFFGNIGDHQLAIGNLEQALSSPSIGAKDTSIIQYSLGYEHYFLEDTTRAKEYFLAAKSGAKDRDPMRYAKSLGEIALIDMQSGNMADAEQLLLEDIKLSELHGDQRNAMFAQIRLGRLYKDTERLAEAQSLIEKADRYVAEKDNLLGFQQEIILLKLELFQHFNDGKAQLALCQKLRQVEEQLKHTDGSDAVKNVKLTLLREQAEWNRLVHESKLQKSNLIGIALLAICTLLIILAVSLRISKLRSLRLQHAVFENKIAAIELAKYKSDNRYEQMQHTIKSYKTFIEERNAAIDHLKEEVSKLESATTRTDVAQREKLEDLLSEHLMSEDNWYRFKRVFMAEYREFYDHVIQQLVGITESQLRIVLLQKIGVSNHEMGNLLGVGQESIRKAKHRLRKKYGSHYEDCFDAWTNITADQYTTQ
ncbi:hypothetical protein [Sphingobacterium corticibacter]|uniref:MalT-like TPR region domain-containing protein n=1 Tax=Sphingobacterium corticibacter TaxID=2171749 RepID=A0A2T8HMD8_9SPHI|nr:hypothetical protein [Sphingobacterium corticibacter]PVH26597.1 hypothetical protein DC487_03010 [Sphingobacterium corticibacter]